MSNKGVFMSNAKFTNREWAFYTKPSSENYAVHIDCGGVMDLTVITRATDITLAESIEREANAHLIAAAPEMYDMLGTIENDSGQVPDWLWDKIQSVLAKARGE